MVEDRDIVLGVSGLRIQFAPPSGPVAVDGIDLSLEAGRTTALVGESGSGKTATALACLRLIPPTVGRVSADRIAFAPRAGERPIDLATLDEDAMQRLRGDGVGMVFQEPGGALNPVRRVGEHVIEAIRLHREVSHRQAAREAAALFERVGLSSKRRRFRAFPHEFSGGMQQRVAIAMGLACKPRLLIADEPTSALDVTTQAKILELLASLQNETGMAILLITHDLGVVARLADDVYVLRRGLIVERGSRDRLFSEPQHPYTRRLLEAARSVSLEDG